MQTGVCFSWLADELMQHPLAVLAVRSVRVVAGPGSRFVVQSACLPERGRRQEFNVSHFVLDRYHYHQKDPNPVKVSDPY